MKPILILLPEIKNTGYYYEQFFSGTLVWILFQKHSLPETKIQPYKAHCRTKFTTDNCIMSVQSVKFSNSMPSGKRLATEMAFSPEANSLESISKLLDMKLQPLHDKIDQVTGKYDEVSQLKEEVLCMKQENYNLKAK